MTGDGGAAAADATGGQEPATAQELTSIIVTGCHPHLTLPQSTSSSDFGPKQLTAAQAAALLAPPQPQRAISDGSGSGTGSADASPRSPLPEDSKSPTHLTDPTAANANTLISHVSTSYRLPDAAQTLSANHRAPETAGGAQTLQTMFAPPTPTTKTDTKQPHGGAGPSGGAPGGPGPNDHKHTRIVVVSNGDPPSMLRTPSVVPSSIEGTIMIIKALADRMFQLQFYTAMCVVCFLLNLFLGIWVSASDSVHSLSVDVS